MKVEVWSDIVCPFCYIGKRKFEKALEDFAGKDKVEIEWKSFQLDPSTQSEPGKSVYEYLAERKGMSLENSKEMHQQVTQMANEVGLDYQFDKAVVANTFDAHRLIHFAAKFDKQGEAKERLLAAYFIEGKNIADLDTLVGLAKELGLDESEARAALAQKTYSDEVKKDIQEAQQLGVRGVPFFVFNRKFAVSGAQSPEVFAGALSKAFAEENKLNIIEGDSCSVDGNC
ncbi:DsbA family protein [Pedobacter sp. SYSU D00535]|uniref:DsbA family oxidoreductase n=1 Tax=Pedobacter sp. SYSU D00535 TaxID=2810308 RepID=UPI001A9715A8|nr:DsbA family oxidoreductase [Pedobacter sp. SYSU D00535]